MFLPFIFQAEGYVTALSACELGLVYRVHMACIVCNVLCGLMGFFCFYNNKKLGFLVEIVSVLNDLCSQIS